MPTGSRARLGRVLDDLGRTLLDVIASAGDLDREVSGIEIYGPGDDLAVGPGSMVLGVGVHERVTIVELLGRLGAHGAVGLVVKQPVEADADVSAAARDSGVTLLGLTRAASWSHVSSLLRSLPLAADNAAGRFDDLAGAPPGDLFALANAVGTLLDAPVTIEDRASRVLAFSGNQDEADGGRVETILGRQVPHRYRDMLEERGAFRRIFATVAPVHLEPLTDQMMPRVAVAVRAGDELLGSMWAAVPAPLSPERMTAFAESAKIVALHILRARAGADVERRLRADLVATVLENGVGAADALTRLGLVDRSLCVLGAQVVAPDVAEAEAATQRLRDALALHFAAIHPSSAAALVGGVVYALLPLNDDGHGTGSVVSMAEDFLARVGPRVDAVVGIGRATTSHSEVVHSRRDVDQALRVLRTDRRGRRVARYDRVQVESLLLRLADLVADDGDLHLGQLARVFAHDDAHDAGLTDTLRAYLDACGNVTQAAEALHVHRNTFRYRLRRLFEIGGLDLDDADARFAAALQLRLKDLAGDQLG